tara:strand:+ start:1517 stop:2740 length:1224 start_codon:yes stop_codon:yes gene_type:complete
MSNLLNESIVDAKALRDSALKNAESVVIEKYAEEVKKTLESLLEQDEPGLEADPLEAGPELGIDADPETESEDIIENEADTIPLASTDDLANNEGDNLNSLASEGENVEVTIDLGALQEAIEALSSDIDEDIDLEIEDDSINEEEVSESQFSRFQDDDDAYYDCKKAHMEDGMSKDEAHKKCDKANPRYNMEESEEELYEEDTEIVDEEIDMDGLFDSVMEKLTADMKAEISGWAGRPTSQLKDEQERELANEASTETEEESVEEEQEEVNESKETLEKTLANNESLKEELVNYQSAMEELKENLYEVNLSNARLLYTNRVLRNTSLNERQKDKIVEAISGAGSVTEAKTIFETLQSTMEAKPTRSPKSLSEAISGRNSVLTASRKETKVASQDPFSDRMRRLAGIK